MIASALACQMWVDKLRAKLYLANVSYVAEQAQKQGKPVPMTPMIDRIAERQRRLLGFPPPAGPQ